LERGDAVVYGHGSYFDFVATLPVARAEFVSSKACSLAFNTSELVVNMTPGGRREAKS
jgi:hypothetical protein